MARFIPFSLICCLKQHIGIHYGLSRPSQRGINVAKQRDDVPEVLMSVYMNRFLYCTKITALVLGLGLLTVANQASAQGLEEIIVTAKKRQGKYSECAALCLRVQRELFK